HLEIENPTWYWKNGSAVSCTFLIKRDKDNWVYICCAKPDVKIEKFGAVYEKSINGKKYKAQEWVISIDTVISGSTSLVHRIISRTATGYKEIK
ncbi:MAG: hypothetical protein ACYC2P_13410, partial [Paludibacteraceae bacterium]